MILIIIVITHRHIPRSSAIMDGNAYEFRVRKHNNIIILRSIILLYFWTRYQYSNNNIRLIHLFLYSRASPQEIFFLSLDFIISSHCAYKTTVV